MTKCVCDDGAMRLVKRQTGSEGEDLSSNGCLQVSHHVRMCGLDVSLVERKSQNLVCLCCLRALILAGACNPVPWHVYAALILVGLLISDVVTQSQQSRLLPNRIVSSELVCKLSCCFLDSTRHLAPATEHHLDRSSI